MQSLNDDMDEVFRRAGEKYPLNTNGSDWNKVMQELHGKENDLPEDNKKKKDYRFFWLLLLLPIGFICGRYVVKNNTDTIEADKMNAAALPDKIKPANAGTGITNAKDKKDGSTAQLAEDRVEKNKPTGVAGNSTGTSTYNTTGKLRSDRKVSNKAINKRDITTAKKTSSLIKAYIPGKGIKDNIGNSVKTEEKPTKKSEDRENKTAGKTSSALPVNAGDSNNLSLQTDTSAVSDTNSKNSTQTNEKPAAAVSVKSIDKKQDAFKGKFNFSIMAGPDWSSVKFQRQRNAGYSIGLMFGYQLKRKVTVEAGVLWDRKNYYADGKYLDTSRLKLPMHSIIINTDGHCDMIEIPVNIKYEFVTKANYSWFVSAGLSGYLMKKEDYNINYTRYNQPYLKEYEYKNSSNNWFSIMNISAGYKKSLGKYSSLSIAPYIKLPLQRVGIGKLPITSTGVYVSFSRVFR